MKIVAIGALFLALISNADTVALAQTVAPAAVATRANSAVVELERRIAARIAAG